VNVLIKVVSVSPTFAE